jgi:hypothetical protein
MTLITPEELSNIADVCRKKGIESIKITSETVEFTLRDNVEKRKYTKKSRPEDNTAESIAVENHPTEDEILFWSAGLPGSETIGHD